MHMMPWALVLDFASAGKSMPARIAIIAITTSSSINVNPLTGAWAGAGDGWSFGLMMTPFTWRSAEIEVEFPGEHHLAAVIHAHDALGLGLGLRQCRQEHAS